VFEVLWTTAIGSSPDGGSAQRKCVVGSAPREETVMRELEIYLPTMTNRGTPIAPAEIERIKETLVQAFGGYTHLNQRFQGAWRMGGVVLHDEVTIVRVLDDGTAPFDIAAFKASLEARLDQEEILIIARNVHRL
jgi:hypothetical protein